MSEQNQSTALWDAVKLTDPAYTKNVSLGKRNYTSITPQYQLQQATKLWGPMGSGWDVTVEYSRVELPESQILVSAEITLTYPAGDWGRGGGISGVRSSAMLAQNGKYGLKIDVDAYKKARTDALTKTLSQLGFSADVFLGLFDDHRYVEHANKVSAQQQSPKPKTFLDHTKCGAWAQDSKGVRCNCGLILIEGEAPTSPQEAEEMANRLDVSGTKPGSA